MNLKLSVAPVEGGIYMQQAAKLLFVDDEAQVLSAMQRLFRAQEYDVTIASSVKEALALIDKNQFDVIISDMRMPEMDGAHFLAACCKVAPHTRRILLTGHSDQESTIRAINDGHIHQYLNKPWDNEQLRTAIEAEIHNKQQRLSASPDFKEIMALQDQVKLVNEELAQLTSFTDLAKDELLEQYNTTIKLISNFITMRLPGYKKINSIVVEHAVAMAKLLKLDQKLISYIRHSALLFQLGKIPFDDDLLNKTRDDLDPEELRKYNRHGVTGADLLTPLNSFDYSAKLIRHQNENYEGSGQPHKLKANKIPLGSRILRLAIDYQMLISGVYFKDALSHVDALAYMEGHSGKKYDPELFRLYKKLIIELDKVKPCRHADNLVPLSELGAKQIVNRDLINHDGMLLIAKGTELSSSMIDKLKSYSKREGRELNVFIQQDLK